MDIQDGVPQDNNFDCDNCGRKKIGETYQDKTGNTFVCQYCFDKSNDGTYFVPAKAQSGNSLRDNIKDLLRGEIGDLIGESFADTETVCAITDSLFSVLDINPNEQDLINPKIVINPKVRITVKGGVAIIDEVTAGIDFFIEDQD